MGIDVQLRNERGDILAEIYDADMTLSRAAVRSAFSATRLLKYLVPWGDAVFNQAQASDLANDIGNILRSESQPRIVRRMEAIALLVDRLSRETHVYLWFIGD